MDIEISLSPIEAQKIEDYADARVREGGIEVAIELASLVQKIRAGRHAATQKANEIGRKHMSSEDDDGVIDATNDFDDDFEGDPEQSEERREFG